MNRLLELRDSDIFPGVQDIDPVGFEERRSARAVVSDDLGRIALVWMANRSHYALPGGGVQKGESIRQALRREILEELGCQIEITGELGKIVEYRNGREKIQTSYCYTARQVGEIGPLNLTEREITDGQETRWLQSINEAIFALESDQPGEDYVGHFIQARDLAFLRAAESTINT